MSTENIENTEPTIEDQIEEAKKLSDAIASNINRYVGVDAPSFGTPEEFGTVMSGLGTALHAVEYRLSRLESESNGGNDWGGASLV